MKSQGSEYLGLAKLPDFRLNTKQWVCKMEFKRRNGNIIPNENDKNPEKLLSKEVYKT